MSKCLNGKSSGPAGFTLIEMIIAIGVLSGIVFVLGTFGLDIYDFGIFLGENIIIQQELQLTLRVMTQELRNMSQSVNGAYPIEAASQNGIVFYSDTDSDGYSEKIRYFLDGNILKKGVIKPSGDPLSYSGSEDISEVVHNVHSASGNIFTYHDANYNGTGDPMTFPVDIASVRLIRVNLTADPNPLDPSSRVNFSNSISIRNL